MKRFHCKKNCSDLDTNNCRIQSLLQIYSLLSPPQIKSIHLNPELNITQICISLNNKNFSNSNLIDHKIINTIILCLNPKFNSNKICIQCQNNINNNYYSKIKSLKASLIFNNNNKMTIFRDNSKNN